MAIGPHVCISMETALPTAYFVHGIGFPLDHRALGKKHAWNPQNSKVSLFTALPREVCESWCALKHAHSIMPTFAWGTISKCDSLMSSAEERSFSCCFSKKVHTSLACQAQLWLDWSKIWKINDKICLSLSKDIQMPQEDKRVPPLELEQYKQLILLPRMISSKKAENSCCARSVNSARWLTQWLVKSTDCHRNCSLVKLFDSMSSVSVQGLPAVSKKRPLTRPLALGCSAALKHLCFYVGGLKTISYIRKIMQ